MSRPILAQIHPAALKNNLAVARRHAGTARIMAAVKANGYGHGLRRVAQALRDADGLAVVSLEEAIILRDTGWGKPILLLEGMFEAGELAECIAQRITLVVHHAEQIAMLEQARVVSPLPVFLNLNSGMNRLGFKPPDFHAALSRLIACPNVGGITLMSHFATADEAVGVIDQLEVIQAVFANLNHPVSLANSAALLRYQATRCDWVRPGIMLYGASPFVEEDARALDLQPAMTLSSRIIAVQTLAPGDAVGYGASFIADRPMRVGIVACGYADGYPRHAATGTPILVNGQLTRTLGRVSMDMLCTDLTDLPGANVDTPVVLWGKGLPVEAVATAAGTVSYELLCAVAQRVPISEA
ncbi:MAG: alanine racemase [Sulfuriferula sp.]